MDTFRSKFLAKPLYSPHTNVMKHTSPIFIIFIAILLLIPTAQAQNKRPAIWPNKQNPTTYLEKYQLITYYGSPLGPGLGILGNGPRETTTRWLKNLVAKYQPHDDRFAMCTWHMITTVANQYPPLYNSQLELEEIEAWVAVMDEYECAIIMDIQPGRATTAAEFQRVAHFLRHPHVHLAWDPEFDMNNEQIPGRQVGQTTAVDVNWIQWQLQQIAQETGINKVLILHQFKDSMLPDKHRYGKFPNVELVIDSDGTFNTDIKLYNYDKYSKEPNFEWGGLKYFYNYDDRIPTPRQTMTLEPAPSVIIYQ